MIDRLYRMTRTWLNAADLPAPGTVLFRSDRSFRPFAYTVGHCTLLLRSWGPANGPGTTIDVMFKAVAAMKLRTTSTYDGLVIRCAGEAEADEVRATIPGVGFDDAMRPHVFLLESRGEVDFVVGRAVGWQEGVLEATRHSFFQESDDLRWPTGPFFANRTGLDVASAQDVIDALATEPDPSKHRDRHRTVYAVLVRASKSHVLKTKRSSTVSGAGVFLTRSDAEQARTLMAQVAGVEESWIEELPIGI
ncbi:hypothetical protein ABIA35_006103 [Catenulispora sp. MAP12-49]|uniref:hypothetical protein n=1 Tax=Catenulispora sp. MAP12-49 TaxID=3156302 RepID=UPI003518355A